VKIIAKIIIMPFVDDVTSIITNNNANNNQSCGIEINFHANAKRNKFISSFIT